MSLPIITHSTTTLDNLDQIHIDVNDLLRWEIFQTAYCQLL